MTLETLIRIAGVLHFGILFGSANVPGTLHWKQELQLVSKVSRQLIWVHGAFIVLTIIGFGALSLMYAAEIASGSPLARGFCVFVGLFWLTRLTLQFVLFDARPLLTTTFLKCGYHGLTLAFLYLSIVYLYGGVVH